MLKTIRRITQEVVAAPSLAAALTAVVQNLRESLNSDAASVFLVDTRQGEYLLSASSGLNPDLVGKGRLKFGQGLVGLIAEREEPINLENATTHPAFYPMPESGEEKYTSFIGVPMFHEGELLGVLVVQRLEKQAFTREDEAFLMTLVVSFADLVAKALAKGALQDLSLARRKKNKTETVLAGVPGASGVAIGKAVVVYPPADLEAVPERTVTDIDAEIKAFELALDGAREEIHELQTRAKATLSSAENALFDAYLRMLDSRSLMSEVEAEIKQGQWAQGAVKHVIKRHILQFESLDDVYLQERAADFRDLGRRILSHLQAEKKITQEYPRQTILVSEEITPAAMMEVPDGCLVGIMSGTGSGNSHVAILARALGLPTVMGVTGTPLSQLANQELIVDGYNGQVYVSPTAALKKEFKALAAEEQQLDSELDALRPLPSETKDGHPMPLYVNTGLAIDGGLSLSAGAQGVGLYRTEMPFMIRDRFPSEEEQRIMYRQLLTIFAPRPVVMRTLDIGGDKSLTYFPVKEENPFLGWRGVRITLDHPEIFIQQLRAMLHASVDLDNLSLMLPMISSVNEVEECIRLVQQAHDELTDEGIKVKMPKVGLMIEVPAAVYQTEELAARVDFISVGSNDLIQYMLAVDRNNPRVAKLYNGLHPAVLRALNDIVKRGHKASCPVTICGELASDPVAVVLLLGMGYDGLSMSARSLLRVKWVIRNFTLEGAKELVKEVLKMDDPVEVRNHVEMALEEAGLGGLIRAGR